MHFRLSIVLPQMNHLKWRLSLGSRVWYHPTHDILTMSACLPGHGQPLWSCEQFLGIRHWSRRSNDLNPVTGLGNVWLLQVHYSIIAWMYDHLQEGKYGTISVVRGSTSSQVKTLGDQYGKNINASWVGIHYVAPSPVNIYGQFAV